MGRPAVISLLNVSTDRLYILRSGRGRLSNLQVDRIATETKKPWQAWAINDFDRRADTPAKRASLDLFAEHQPKEIVRAAGFKSTPAKEMAVPSKLRARTKVSA
jgi:hypothetical protein